MWQEKIKNRNFLIIAALVLVVIVGFSYWFYKESEKLSVGQKIADLGREHVPLGTQVEYNSNPPTSGPHYEEWVKGGILENVRDDRNLVHSLEHGYIIMSYNCSFTPTSWFSIPQAYAQRTMSALPDASSSADSTPSALPEQFSTDDCKSLVSNLTSVYDKKGKWKLIVIPRPNLDSKLALTAWNRIEKLNQFDEGKINLFIDALRDQGPEKTIE